MTLLHQVFFMSISGIGFIIIFNWAMNSTFIFVWSSYSSDQFQQHIITYFIHKMTYIDTALMFIKSKITMKLYNSQSCSRRSGFKLITFTIYTKSHLHKEYFLLLICSGNFLMFSKCCTSFKNQIIWNIIYQIFS